MLEIGKKINDFCQNINILLFRMYEKMYNRNIRMYDEPHAPVFISKNKCKHKSVIAIPPSYYKNECLDVQGVLKYIHYLVECGATTLMTTAGTSQFNLLTTNEIHIFNKVVATAKCSKIFGIPPISSNESVKFVRRAKEYIGKSNLMVLYPDRFYDYGSIYSHIAKIREASLYPVYLHAMPMRKGTGGEWNFTSDIISSLFEKKLICGIKEEHSNLQESYNFIRNLPPNLDVIVAGGSMRRHQFLKTAGANSFLSGIGNLFPQIEINYCNEIDSGRFGDSQIALESKLFDVFLKYGWHPSLRVALAHLGLLSHYNRNPWPKLSGAAIDEIKNVISEVVNEK